MKIARVFPRKTSYSPQGEDVYFGSPDLFTPRYDKVEISISFTWDRIQGENLMQEWGNHADQIEIGGPGMGDPGGEFIPGRYIKRGITITSRGCNKNCSFCYVPGREGKIRELKKIYPGNIINDNNLLQCSRGHVRKVFNMLKDQSRIRFPGGLQYDLITDEVIEDLRGLRIEELWIACDRPGSLKRVKKKIGKLRRYFPQWKIRCYVLIGFDMEEEKSRLIELFKAGCFPFAQLFQGDTKKEYSKEWKRFHKLWSRPALYKKYLKETRR